MISSKFHSSHQYAKIEVERRFLLRNMPEDLDPDEPFLRIYDLYLTNTRLRLRRIESPAGEMVALKLGQKYRAPGQSALLRTMTSIYLNDIEYRILSSLTGSTLIKRRYSYPYAGYHTSIDFFESHLGGLILLEIQSQLEKDINSLPIPAFTVREVTDELLFTGGELAQLTKEEFQELMVSL